MQKILALREQLLKITDKIKCFAPLFTRFTLGIVFIQSGGGKLQHLDGVIDYFTQLGIPAPQLQAPFVAGMELVCGLAIAIGFLTRLASLPIIAMMVVAIITARKDDLHSLNDLLGFIEYLYIVLAVWLVLDGPGKISLDYFFCGRGKNRDTRA